MGLIKFKTWPIKQAPEAGGCARGDTGDGVHKGHRVDWDHRDRDQTLKKFKNWNYDRPTELPDPVLEMPAHLKFHQNIFLVAVFWWRHRKGWDGVDDRAARGAVGHSGTFQDSRRLPKTLPRHKSSLNSMLRQWRHSDFSSLSISILSLVIYNENAQLMW